MMVTRLPSSWLARVSRVALAFVLTGHASYLLTAGRRAVDAYHGRWSQTPDKVRADRIVAERNFGGAMVEHVIKSSSRPFLTRNLGHSVAEAHSAAAALNLLEEQPFDLVITDHAMPKMTGLQLFDATKDKWPDTPVI